MATRKSKASVNTSTTPSLRKQVILEPNKGDTGHPKESKMVYHNGTPSKSTKKLQISVHDR